MAVSIVTTTINQPVLLRDYCLNARKFGHRDVRFVVAGDRQTPKEVPAYCQELARDFDYQVEYLGVEEQQNWLSRFSELRDHLPFDSLARRNVAILKSYLDGADVIITIDDDNFVLEEQDFVGWHRGAGQTRPTVCVQSDTGWFNVCEMLEEEKGRQFYHRGFPWHKRWQESRVVREKRTGRVVVNAGLWLGAPDVDAVTWLDSPLKATGFKKGYEEGVTLMPGTWSPFNSQNTALAREVVPAYFLSPYLGRYDDVWASYIVRRIADHLGDYVRFGFPLVRQVRNSHNYLVDFDRERLGLELTEDFVEGLRQFALHGSTYAECYGEVVEYVAGFVKNNEKVRRQGDFGRAVGQLVQGMKIWQGVMGGKPEPKRVSLATGGAEGGAASWAQAASYADIGGVGGGGNRKRRVKINLASGERPLPGFLNVDIRDIPGIEYPNTSAEDLTCFEDETADYIYACHVLDHIPRERTFRTLCEWNRVLKVGGMLRLSVPDWDALVQYYNKTRDLINLLNFTYGGSEDPTNRHYRGWNFDTLKTLLWEAGFKRITRYDWRETEHADHDDFSKAYIPHMDTENGILMSINAQCIKHTYIPWGQK